MDPTGRIASSATSEFRVTALGGCLLILLCLAGLDTLDLLGAHSRQMCCFHNSNSGRIAVRNLELNTFNSSAEGSLG